MEFPTIEPDPAQPDEHAYGTPVRSSFGWAVLGRVGSQLIQLLGTVVLGRIVAPAQFGVLAAAAIFVALGTIFTDLGLGPAIVHRERPAQDFLRTAFWLNALSGFALTLLSVGIAFPLSLWFGFGQLVWVVPLIGLTFSVSLGTVGLALMERGFRFRAIALADASAVLIGQGIAIAVATFGPATVLALALAPPCSAAALSLIIMSISGWRPGWRPHLDRESLGALRGFVAYLSLSNIVTFSARNGDDFFLGRFVSATSLAMYARSYQLMLLPVTQITQGLSRSMQATFARAKNDRGELQRLHTLSETGAFTLGLFAAVVLYSLAPAGIPLVLGNQWQDMVPIFQIFSLSIPAQCLGVINGSLYIGTGNVRLLFTASLLNSALLVIGFVIAAPHGATVVAIFFTVHAFATLPITLTPILRRLRISFGPVLPRLALLIVVHAALFVLLEVVPRALAPVQVSAGRLGTQVAVVVVAVVVALVALRHGAGTYLGISATARRRAGADRRLVPARRPPSP